MTTPESRIICPGKRLVAVPARDEGGLAWAVLFVCEQGRDSHVWPKEESAYHQQTSPSRSILEPIHLYSTNYSTNLVWQGDLHSNAG